MDYASLCKEYAEYIKETPTLAILNKAEKKEERFEKNAEGFYTKSVAGGLNEANIALTGQLSYNDAFGRHYTYEDAQDFKGAVKHLRKCLSNEDLVIGNLNTMVVPFYQKSDRMREKFSKVRDYQNADRAYFDALKYAGFGCLAMSSPNNAMFGVPGLAETKRIAEEEYGFLTGGTFGSAQYFEINTIKICILSYSVAMRSVDKYFNEKGCEELLSVYSPEKLKADIKTAREKGAEFIILYVNCSNEEGDIPYDKRKELATEAAEAGVDYVVCTVKKYLSKYKRIKTSDGRKVPVILGLNTLIGGSYKDNTAVSAVIKVRLLRKDDGGFNVKSVYSPTLCCYNFKGYGYAPIPAVRFYHGKLGKVENQKLAECRETAAKEIGSVIKAEAHHQTTMKADMVPHFTFADIYRITGAKPSLRDRLKLNMNGKASIIAVRKQELMKDCVAIMINYDNFYKKDEVAFTVEDAVKAGAKLLIDEKPSDKLPTIVMNRPYLAYTELCSQIVDMYKPFTVAITGTSGKTTTKDLTDAVFDTQYNTLCIQGNYNTVASAGVVMQKLTADHKAYVQEVHGGSPGSAKQLSEILKPDVAIITSIGAGHLSELLTMENVVKAKVDVTAGLKKNGVLIVDDDNEYLHKINPNCKVIRYSIGNPECDYYAKDIRNDGDRLRFKICCKEGGEYDALLNIQGLHNVRNALAAFAAGRQAKIPPYKIVAGLTHFSPSEDKQNLTEIAGYKLLIDSYSSTEVSVKSALKGLTDYPLEKGCRKIALLGDIPGLGPDSPEIHKRVGKEIADEKFDIMLCCGQDSKYFVEAAKANGKEAYFYDDREEFNKKIVDYIKPGDFILFKAGTRTHFKEETIYPIFGKIV